MNRDQREVLLHMGDERAVLNDAGWDHMMQSMRGGCGPGEGHTIHRYECRGGKITAEFHDGTTTVVTKAQMVKWRKTVDPVLLADLAAADEAAMEHYLSTLHWCMCPQQRGEGKCFGNLPGEPQRYHPTDVEYDAKLRQSMVLREREKEALRAALQLMPEPQPGEQLELFG